MENGIVQAPDPYDTDLPVISDGEGAFVLFFFRGFFLVWSEESGLFFCWLLLLLLEFLVEMSRTWYIHTVIQVKLLPTLCVYSLR